MKEMPFGLKAVCIVAIVFSALGILGGGLGLLGLFIKQPDRAALAGGPQAELNQRLQENAKKLRPVQLVLVPVALTASILLLVAGIAGLKLQALGFIRLAFAASLVTDSISAVIGISAQMKMMSVLQDYFRTSPGATDSSVAMGMKFGVSVGLFFAVGWLLAKAGFYVGSLVFFSKRAVREAFMPPPGPA